MQYISWGAVLTGRHWSSTRQVTGKMTPDPDTVISLSILLQPPVAQILCELEAAPSGSFSSSHVICRLLQFS